MLDFNRHYYDEICGNSPSRNTRFDAKPGKDDSYGTSLVTPKTIRLEYTNADEKRFGPCVAKAPTEIRRYK